MRVIIVCECSGAVRRAFVARGHEAYSCDIMPAEDGGPHLLSRSDGETLWLMNTGKWDLAVTHPECRYLNAAGMHWTTRGLRDPQLTERALSLVKGMLASNIPKLALENPIGCISTRIRKPDQIIQPYYFGEDASKGTCLWLKNLPSLKMTRFVPPRMVCKCGTTYRQEEEFRHGCPKCGPGHAKPRWANQCDSGQNRLGPSPTRAMDRARTYQGIADAMAAQWG